MAGVGFEEGVGDGVEGEGVCVGNGGDGCVGRGVVWDGGRIDPNGGWGGVCRFGASWGAVVGFAGCPGFAGAEQGVVRGGVPELEGVSESVGVGVPSVVVGKFENAYGIGVLEADFFAGVVEFPGVLPLGGMAVELLVVRGGIGEGEVTRWGEGGPLCEGVVDGSVEIEA